MPVQNDLATARNALDTLDRAAARLRAELGDTLDVRRLRADLERLRESLELLDAPRAAADATGVPAPPGPPHRPGLVEIPDTPYDPTLWQGAGDEGIGRHET